MAKIYFTDPTWDENSRTFDGYLNVPGEFSMIMNMPIKKLVYKCVFNQELTRIVNGYLDFVVNED